MDNDKIKIVKKLAKLLHKSIVILDTETTGTRKDFDEIITLAAIRINPDGTNKELHITCKPKVPIHPEASKVNGITAEIVKDEPYFEHFAKDIVELLKDADIVGFNIAFDIAFVDRQLSEAGFKDIFSNKIVYCTYLTYLKQSTRKLKDAYKYYTNKDIKDAHDAMGDVLSTMEIMQKQLEKEDKTYAQMLELSSPKDEQKIGYTNHILIKDGKHILNFGKSKGEELSKVDKGFLKWIMTKDFPKEVKKCIGTYLD